MNQDHISRDQQHVDEQKPTYLYINITMDPLIVVERTNEQDFYTGFEKTPFLTEGTEWMNRYTEDFFS